MVHQENAIMAKNLYLKVRNRYNTMARHTVQIQLERRADELDAKRQDIVQACNRSDTQVLQEVLEQLQADTVKLHHLTAGLSQPFLLFLVGTGKFGKSTLINALLGCEMAQVDLLPKTWKIDIFYGGSGNMTEICYRDGHKESKTFEETLTLIQSEEEKREVSEQKVQDMFEENRNRFKTLQAKKEYQQELRKYMLYRSEITEIHWPVPISSPLLKNFRLVDTPGTQQQMTLGHVEASAADYYSKADGILWLLAADKISAKDTRQNIDLILDRFGRRTDNIVAVLNKKDLVEHNGGPGALARVEADARRLYGDVFQKIVPISASQALKAVLDSRGQTPSSKTTVSAETPTSMLDASGLPQLLNVIDRHFLTQAQQIQVRSKIAGTQSILLDISLYVAAFRDRLMAESQKREELKTAWEKEKMNLSDTAGKMIDSCFNSQVSSVLRRAQAHENELWDLEGYDRQRILENEVFQNSTFKCDADQVIKKIINMIENSQNIYQQDSAFYEYPDLQKESGQLTTVSGSNINGVSVDRDVFSIESGSAVVGGIAAIGAAALLGPVGLLAGLVVQADAFKSLRKWVSRLFTNLPQKITNQYSSQLDSIKYDLKKELNHVLDQAELEVSHVREQTYADLYGDSTVTATILDRLDEITDLTDLQVEPLTLNEVMFGKKKGEPVCKP